MAFSELFGPVQHRALLKRGEDLWRLVEGHPRYAYYGTTVSLSDPGGDSVDVLGRLARLQGLGMCFYFPETNITGLRTRLERQGFRTAQSRFHRGDIAAYKASTALLTKQPEPSGVKITRLDETTSVDLVQATVDLCQSCGLSSMPGEVMRGTALPGINLVALDRYGTPVATAASYAMHAPGTPRATEAFWGALATREDFRGRGLAVWLGAMAIVHMWEKEGMRTFNTGVKEDNFASQAACAKLGIQDTDLVTAFCFDDARLETG